MAKLTPEFSESLYQNAQYDAQKGNAQKSIDRLETAVKLDKFYYLKANSDEAFNPVRMEVNNFFKRRRDEVRLSCLTQFKILLDYLKEINDLLSSIKAKDIRALYINNFKDALKSIERLIDRNRYFDILYAKEKIKETVPIITSYKKTQYESLDRLYVELTSKIRNIHTATEKGRTIVGHLIKYGAIAISGVIGFSSFIAITVFLLNKDVDDLSLLLGMVLGFFGVCAPIIGIGNLVANELKKAYIFDRSKKRHALETLEELQNETRTCMDKLELISPPRF